MRYYQSVIGGEFTILARYKDMPGSEKLMPEDQEKLIHISLVVNNDLTLMATDVLDNMDRDIVQGNHFYVQLQTDSEAEAERLLQQLSAGGKVDEALHPTSYHTQSGTCIDQFGVPWMISVVV